MKFDKSTFAEQVYALTKLIPAGRVCSYGFIAQSLGYPKQARMVGWALNNCPADVPAHRVVNRSGILTAKLVFGGDKMEVLLKAEGIAVVDDRVQEFKKKFWNPMEELSFE